MAERHRTGVLDTSVYIDFDLLDPVILSAVPEITAITGALTLSANRVPQPRRMDLLIAAVASSRGLPLYTRNEDDLKVLEDMVEVVAV